MAAFAHLVRGMPQKADPHLRTLNLAYRLNAIVFHDHAAPPAAAVAAAAEGEEKEGRSTPAALSFAQQLPQPRPRPRPRPRPPPDGAHAASIPPPQPPPATASTKKDADAGGVNGSSILGRVAAIDGALPHEMVAKLQQGFRPDGAFWREHGYDADDAVFFSYL